ncbi:MAG: thiamine-binding protein [Lewinellaceae bacterium]|nr:thiamine-binding protein [Saprospiraceae bacterium]MCB9337468.1 thiamine-binding protein [Lewinellaceae bacterium]
MRASVEISMYPFQPDYGTPILHFIERLRRHKGLTLHTNTMSTQIFGDYGEIMGVLTQEMKAAFEEGETTVMVMKIANLDLRP